MKGLPQHIRLGQGRQSQSDKWGWNQERYHLVFNICRKPQIYLSEILAPFLLFSNRHPTFTGVEHTRWRVSCHLKSVSTIIQILQCFGKYSTFVGKEHLKSYLTAWLTTWWEELYKRIIKVKFPPPLCWKPVENFLRQVVSPNFTFSVLYFFDWHYHTLAKRIALPKLTSVNSFNVKSTWKIFLVWERNSLESWIFYRLASYLELVSFLLDYECHLLSNLPAESELLIQCLRVDVKYGAHLPSYPRFRFYHTDHACLSFQSHTYSLRVFLHKNLTQRCQVGIQSSPSGSQNSTVDPTAIQR